MERVNNNYLIKRIALHREIKEKEKELKEMDKCIKAFIQARTGKELITCNAIAYFQHQNRTMYDIPDDVKSKYSYQKEYEILKVEKRT